MYPIVFALKAPICIEKVHPVFNPTEKIMILMSIVVASVITTFFHKGFTQKEIQDELELNHGVSIR